MSVNLNADLVRKWVNVWLSGEVGVLGEIFAENYCVNGRKVGIESVQQAVQLSHAALSDMTIELSDLICEGDKAVARWTVNGIHTGNFLGIPATNSPLVLKPTSFVGLIVCKWFQFKCSSQMCYPAIFVGRNTRINRHYC